MLPNRAERRFMARQAPPRRCTFCGVAMTRVFDPDTHIARHLEEAGIPKHEGRQMSRQVDARLR